MSTPRRPTPLQLRLDRQPPMPACPRCGCECDRLVGGRCADCWAEVVTD